MSFTLPVGSIDTHHHFWVYNEVRDAWIDDSMKVIQRDFLPADLQPVLETNGLEGCITVQSDQSLEENDFQLANAENNHFVKGIVGWVDLQSAKVGEQLSYISQFPKMKGVRHVLQGEEQRDLMLTKPFLNGIKELKYHNLKYDILIFDDQLQYIPEFLKKNEQQLFVIDHIAKPKIKTQETEPWRKGIEALKDYDNVLIKVSGMVTEADWQHWKYQDFVPYLDIVLESFGTDRIMYGSDWPVCNVAGGYEQMLSITKKYFANFSDAEKEKIFKTNGKQFYNVV
ncbi:amidohydrolase family protein [Polluticaenibacter yanchengensis]|uniref:Amidohydrolase family protein n=1 Tax=Polluticaenibacter yanchengensis TaxID=3014562 RepID=A0ABT4UFH2_9BACT|nr:amidohydrolase family protein [Chitinophagaceae bacterium LY-5]